uniref:HTH cro/C1-type domain-containing protein n=1 Tax=Seriola lalandi dorsalis TaxID=1841481 RepID=A0A3B4WS19_SERLL
MSAAKLDAETEELKHKTVSKDLRLAISKARTAKGLTQKQLATQLNMQPQVINEYESGKAIPNNAIIAKIERALGAKLPVDAIGLAPAGCTLA